MDNDLHITKQNFDIYKLCDDEGLAALPWRTVALSHRLMWWMLLWNVLRGSRQDRSRIQTRACEALWSEMSSTNTNACETKSYAK
jgi:hypothetical protein